MKLPGGNQNNIRVNGKSTPLDVGNVAELLVRRGHDAEGEGLAVAVNGEVIPRAQWHKRALDAGDEVEIVGAVQGG